MEIPIETLNGYSNYLKDHLSRIYEFILRHKDSEQPHLKNIDFTKKGIDLAIRSLSHNVWDSTTVFTDKFFANLDLMKKLHDEQPQKLIAFEYEYNINGEMVLSTYTKEFKTYNLEDLERRILNEGKHLRIRIISSKNLQLTF